MLLNYHIGRFVLGLLCVGGLVRFSLSSIRAVGFSVKICPSSGLCDYAVELPQWSFHSWFAVCWRFGAVWL